MFLFFLFFLPYKLLDGKEMKDLMDKLEAKEKIMLRLLSTIDGVGSKLVDAGILPSIPGLFSNKSDSSNESTGEKTSDKIRGNENTSSSHFNTSSHGTKSIEQESTSSDTKLLEKQLAASTSFIASLGSGAKTLFSPSYRSSVVSDALRLLIQNMELFKSYLIEVENLRRKLNLLQVERNICNEKSLDVGETSDEMFTSLGGKSKEKYVEEEEEREENDDDESSYCKSLEEMEAYNNGESKFTYSDWCKCSNEVEQCECSKNEQVEVKVEEEEEEGSSNYGEKINVGDFSVDIATGKYFNSSLSSTYTSLMTAEKCCKLKNDKSNNSHSLCNNFDDKNKYYSMMFDSKLNPCNLSNCCSGSCITSPDVTSKTKSHLQMVNEEASKFNDDEKDQDQEGNLSKLNDEQVECQNERGQVEKTTRSFKEETKSDHRQESPKLQQLATVARTIEEDEEDQDEEEEEVDDESKVTSTIQQLKSSSGIETQTGISALVNAQKNTNDKTVRSK